MATDRIWRTSPSVIKAWSCCVINHEQVGGVTDWKGTNVATNWSVPPFSALVRRKLGHVLEHGDSPTLCSEKLDFLHLTEDALLPLKERILPDVAFHTFSSCMGWGRRQINCK
jgi:hypothetical protein